MASTTPAVYMGLNKGKIEIGYDADFIAVNENNQLCAVVIDGKLLEEDV